MDLVSVNDAPMAHAPVGRALLVMVGDLLAKAGLRKPSPFKKVSSITSGIYRSRRDWGKEALLQDRMD